jgi:hypothetical protein
METPTVAIPVRCPKCGALGTSEFPVAVVAIALVKWNNMCLYAPCHEGCWDASDKELEAIRRHLGRDWIGEHSQAILAPRALNLSYLDRSQREGRYFLSASQVKVVSPGAFSLFRSRPRATRNLN